MDLVALDVGFYVARSIALLELGEEKVKEIDARIDSEFENE